MARYEDAVVAAVDEARVRIADPRRPGRLDGRALIAAPEEVALRLLAAAIVGAGTPCAAEKPLRLQRLEALWHDLRAAIAAWNSSGENAS